jgi:hypothetical protein
MQKLDEYLSIQKANSGMSWSYTQAEGNKQPHRLVGKPLRCLPDLAHILSPRWCGGKLVFAFPAEKARSEVFCLDYPLLLGGNGTGTGQSDISLKCNTAVHGGCSAWCPWQRRNATSSPISLTLVRWSARGNRNPQCVEFTEGRLWVLYVEVI